METETEFIFLGSKITADGDYSHEIKRCLFLVRKAMTNLDSILKSRDITLPIKVLLVKAMVFSSSHVWMWELDYKENWVPKNWCFWTVVLNKTLESPLDSKEIKPVHPKGNHPEYSLEGLMLKLKLQYFHHLKQRTVSLENPLKLGKIEGRRRRGQRMRWLDGSLTWWMWVWVNSGSWWWTRRPGVLQSMGLQRVGHEWATELNWTDDSQKEGDPLTSPRSSSTWRHPCLAFSPQLKAKVTGISDPETSLQAKLLVVVSLATHTTGAENARWAEIHACCFTEMY